jgi:hypothetical protein
MAVYQHVRLGEMTTGARRGLTYLLVVGVAINAAAFWLSARAVNDLRYQQTRLHAAVIAQCKFNADLGAAPVTVNPATGKASALGVSIISDARMAWHGLGCPGRLAPPEPSFVKWAKRLHVPVTR